MALPLALRASEARETMGVEGVGQALLQVLVVVQVGVGVVLLNLPYHVMAALIALRLLRVGLGRRDAAWAGLRDGAWQPNSARSC